MRMTECRSRCGISHSSLSLESRHHAVRQCLHGPHGRFHRNGYPHAIWHGRFSAGRIQNWLGVLGSHYARFTQFVRGPRAVLQSIRAPVDAPATRPLGHYRLSRYSSRCLCKSAQGSSLMTIFLPKGRSLLGSLMRRPASSQQFTRPIFGFLAG